MHRGGFERAEADHTITMTALSSLSSHLRGASLAGSATALLENADWTGQLSNSLSPASPFAEALLHDFVLPGEISALAVDPLQGYVAVGTQSGTVHLFGSPAVEISWPLRPTQPVKFLLFKPGTPLLICADSRENLSIYDLSKPDPAAQAKANTRGRTDAPYGLAGAKHNIMPVHPDTPTRVAASTARNAITTLHLSPSHSHLFIGLRDGTVDTYDLDRLQPSPYRVPNCWYEEEELLRKSGVPDAPTRRHVPLVIDMATSPTDIGSLVLAYEGGAVLLDIQERSVLASFQLRLLPGAPGAGGISPQARWTERASPATCIAWRPDGKVLAIGHEDGLISFWNPQDDSKPLLVRSLDGLDLDRSTVDDMPDQPAREPIFKMAWAGLPERSWFASFNGEQHSSASAPAVEEEGATLLTILGGGVPDQDPPGVSILHFRPVKATEFAGGSMGASFWSTGSASTLATPEALHRARKMLRTQVETFRESRLLSAGVVQDFVLLPRSSPHHCMAWDPIAIIMLVDAPHGLPPLSPPSARRGIVAAQFPPLPPPGKSATSPAKSSIPSPSSDSTLLRQGPTLVPPADVVAANLLPLPFALSATGAGAVLGAQLVNLSLGAYRKLTATSTNDQGSYGGQQPPGLPLEGGLAAPVGIGGREHEEQVKASGAHRLLITHHLDGTVRFADVSNHLTLLPSHNLGSSAAGQRASSGASGGNTVTSPLLDRPFPSPLPHLTISIADAVAQDPRQQKRRHSVRISSVHFAPEVLELSVVERLGCLFHYKYGHARFSQSSEVEADLQTDLTHDNEAAAKAAFSVEIDPGQAVAPQGVSLSRMADGQEDVQIGSHLESNMQEALADLNIAAPVADIHSVKQDHSLAVAPGQALVGPPPPKPKRDPKRGSIMSRLSRDKGEPGELHDQQLSSPASESLSTVQTRHRRGSSTHQTQTDLHSGSSEPFLSLERINDWSVDGFKANVSIDLGRGEITHIAASDVGFLAIACGSGLAVVDLRGPEILLCDGMGDDFCATVPTNSKASGPKRAERKLLEAESKAAITSLAWTVCRIPGAHPAHHCSLLLRLLIGRSNGLVTVWTFSNTLDMWLPERTGAIKIDELESKSVGAGAGLTVLDVAGNEAAATPSELQRALRESSRAGNTESLLDSDVPLLLAWSGQNIVLNVGILGTSKWAKVNTSEPILSAAIVDRHMEKVVIAISLTSIRLYSAPKLELIHRIQRHGSGHLDHSQISNVAIGRGSAGLFLEMRSTLDVSLRTLFGQATLPIQQPALLLWTPKSVPAHPGAGAVSSLTSWFSQKGATQHSLDDILAGPNRPSSAPKLPPVKTREEFLVAVTGQPASATGTAAFPTNTSAEPESSKHLLKAPATRISGQKERHTQSPHASTAVLAESREAQGTMWNNLDLARRRGEAMQGLENSLASLERSANSWVKEAKSGLIKSAAKDKLTKFGM